MCTNARVGRRLLEGHVREGVNPILKTWCEPRQAPHRVWSFSVNVTHMNLALFVDILVNLLPSFLLPMALLTAIPIKL